MTLYIFVCRCFPQYDSPQVSPVTPSSPTSDSVEKKDTSRYSTVLQLGIIWARLNRKGITWEEQGDTARFTRRNRAVHEKKSRGLRDEVTSNVSRIARKSNSGISLLNPAPQTRDVRKSKKKRRRNYYSFPLLTTSVIFLSE